MCFYVLTAVSKSSNDSSLRTDVRTNEGIRTMTSQYSYQQQLSEARKQFNSI